MTNIRPIALSIDQQLGVASDLVDGLGFIAARMDDEDCPAVRPAGIAIINAVADRLKNCRRQVEILHQVAVEE